MKSINYIISLLIIAVLVFIGNMYVNQPNDFVLFTALSDTNSLDYLILWKIRIPRFILALLAGGGLSLAGYLMQHLTNNSLADPYLLGTAGGASLGANLVITGLVPLGIFSIGGITIGAFLVALLVTVLLMVIAHENGKINVFKLLLGGVALTSLTGSLNTLILFMVSDKDQLTEIIFWSMGALSRATWTSISILSVVLFSTLILLVFLKKELSLILLGEEKASLLGMKVEQFKWGIVILSTLITAVTVSFTGPIGFIGLFIPHFIRHVFGVNGAFNSIFVVLTGGVFLATCDGLSKVIYPPVGLPIGIITAILGIPFFIFLVIKSNYKF